MSAGNPVFVFPFMSFNQQDFALGVEDKKSNGWFGKKLFHDFTILTHRSIIKIMEENQNNPLTESIKESCCSSCSKKSCWKWVFLVVFLFLAASFVYAGYQFSQLSQKPAVIQSSLIPIPDPTANWGKCKSDSDCVVGIKVDTTGCCRCPMAISRDQVGKDGWEVFVKGKDYSMRGENCSKITCVPCQPLDFNSPICSAGKCIRGENLPIDGFNKYVCPKNGWVDCSLKIITPEEQPINTDACSAEALEWYKKNCPNFQGGAY